MSDRVIDELTREIVIFCDSNTSGLKRFQFIKDKIGMSELLTLQEAANEILDIVKDGAETYRDDELSDVVQLLAAGKKL